MGGLRQVADNDFPEPAGRILASVFVDPLSVFNRKCRDGSGCA